LYSALLDLSSASYLPISGGPADGSPGGGIAIDAYGNAYVTGTEGGDDGCAFVDGLNSTGTGMLFSTGLDVPNGGSPSGTAIAVDSSGNIYFYCVPEVRCSNRRGGKRLRRCQW
jgi:hypothetical protein